MKDIGWFFTEPPESFGCEAAIWAGDGDELACVYSSARLGVSAAERAERIVKAVNNYDQLIEDYRELKQVYKELLDRYWWEPTHYLDGLPGWGED